MLDRRPHIGKKGLLNGCVFRNLILLPYLRPYWTGKKGGHFGFKVTSDYKVTQSYVPHTNILSTHFESEEGAFDVVDFMPCYPTSDGKDFYRPAEIYRYIRWAKGRPRMKVDYRPAPNYARERPFIT